MKTKVLKRMIMLIGLGGMLAGCATTGNNGTGAVGNQSQAVSGSGPNGSINSANPLGVGTGTGITR